VSKARQVSDIYFPDPDEPGWYRWTPEGRTGFAGIFGDIGVKPLGPGRARVRIDPQANLNSATGAIHGGALAGYVDIVIFAGAVGSGVEFAGGGASTVDLSIQYLTQAYVGQPLEAELEVTRDGGRLVFVRGMIEQGGAQIASFNAIFRKNSQPRA
jgi:acyl-coenzyme A thioesterase PaaI-like protein